MNDINNRVTRKLENYYTDCIKTHGPSAKGVGWLSAQRANLRYDRMLKVIDNMYNVSNPSLLDVGCGYGALLDYAKDRKIEIDYTGIDVSSEMIKVATTEHPDTQFINKDILDYNDKTFDYVVCNGILTLKLDNNLIEMDSYFKEIVKHMFNICRIGMAFNVYSTYVGWFGEKTYYKNPLEIMAFCLSEMSIHVKLDHSYRNFEYTVYVYKSNESLDKFCIDYKSL